MHELMHGLGPQRIRLAGRETTVRLELKDVYAAIEEAKADISGLWALQQLVDKGVLDRSFERTMYTTFLASAFRSIRFGTGDAHGKGQALQLNRLLDAGGFRVAADGTFSVDPGKIAAAVTELTRDLLTIEAQGDYARAKALLDADGGRATRDPARARPAEGHPGGHRAALHDGRAPEAVMAMSALFSSLPLRGLTLRNRIAVSPMCQYSSQDGLPGDWHLVHLGSRAVGGAGLVITEATAVSPEGRISPGDTGIWTDAQAEAWKPIARFVKEQGAVAADPARARRPQGLDRRALARRRGPRRTGRRLDAGRAERAAVRGRLPDAARADDGGDPRDRRRLRRRRRAARSARASTASRSTWRTATCCTSSSRRSPTGAATSTAARSRTGCASRSRSCAPCARRGPPIGRCSCASRRPTGPRAAGTSSSRSSSCRRLREAGVDLVDCSSGGQVPNAKVAIGPGYQVPFAAAIRERGRDRDRRGGPDHRPPRRRRRSSPAGKADLVLLARELLRDPYWPLHAAQALGASIDWPVQYLRARPSPS